MAKHSWAPWGYALVGLVVGALAFSATDAHADLAPPPEPKPRATRLQTQKAGGLADGMYVGPLVSENTRGEIQLTVVRGFVVEAFIRRSGEGLAPFDLVSSASSNAAGILLQGSEGNEFVRASGELIDAERGRGKFEGVLMRKQTTGTWSVSRR